MDYIKNKLAENEHIVYSTGLHWAILLGPSMLLIIAGLSIPAKGQSAVILLIIGLMWFAISTVSIRTSEIGITEKRLLLRVGFPLRRSYDILLEKIQMIDIYQPSLGKFLNFGKIIIQYSNGGANAFRMVRSPIEFKDMIEKQAAAIRQQ